MMVRMKRQQDTPHNADPVHAAYSARAHEYIDLLGHIDSTAPEDRKLVDQWARKCTGRVIDVGCGPGHWTAYLTEAGINATGIAPVPEFVDHAMPAAARLFWKYSRRRRPEPSTKLIFCILLGATG